MKKIDADKSKKSIRSKAILSIIALIVLLVSVISGCGIEEAMPTQEDISSSNERHMGMLVKDENVQQDTSQEDIEVNESCHFYESNGIPAVYIESENIEAFLKEGFITDFELNDWEIDFPPSERQEIGTTTYWPDGFEYDWSIFQHRLFCAKYNLRIHYSLEPEIDRIIRRNLIMDKVIPGDDEFVSDIVKTNFLNTEIFERFINENVKIEIIDIVHPDIEDYKSQLEWLVYQGGCRFEFGVCTEHLYLIWLVDFNDSNRIIWDMKTVTNPGCGCQYTY